MTQTINSLCTAIRVFIEKGDRAKGSSEQYYAQAGTRLVELKARKPKGEAWPAYVRKHCGLSQERADELIRIAEGRTTVDAVRARVNASAARSKAAKASRKSSDAITGSPRKPGRPRAFPPFVPGEGCDFDPTSEEEKPNEPYRVTRARGYFAAIREALDLAELNLMTRNNPAVWAVDPDEITDEVIAAAQRVVDAWKECVEKLHNIKKGKSHGKDKDAMGAALH
jgi:hypothetical protein